MKPFDVAAARKAGYSDVEIAQYLAHTGRSEQEIHEHLGTKPEDAVADESQSQGANQEQSEGAKAGEGPQHDYSSTQINLPPHIAKRIRGIARAIPKKHLAPDGREKDPHVTLKYGLHTEDPEEVRRLIENERPIRVRLGAISRFPDSGSGDVLKVDVDSPDLHRLNKKISEGMKHTDTFPTYNPHATLAYVQPGKGKEFDGKGYLKGAFAVVDTVVFSGKDGRKSEIKLKGKSKVSAGDKHGEPPKHDQDRRRG